MHNKTNTKKEKDIFHLFLKTFLTLILLVVLPIMIISIYFNNAASDYWKNDLLIYQQKSFLNYANSIDNKISQVIDVAGIISKTIARDPQAADTVLLESITDTVKYIKSIKIYENGSFSPSVIEPFFFKTTIHQTLPYRRKYGLIHACKNRVIAYCRRSNRY